MNASTHDAQGYDVIIIGAGMAGLGAGIRLAMFDRRVLILERHGKLGGLNSYYKKGGHDLDVGLHAVTNYSPKGARGRPLTRMLRQLRIPHDELALRPHRLSEIRFPDACVRFECGDESFRAGLVDAFPQHVPAIDRLFAEMTERGSSALQTDGTGFRSARAFLADIGLPPALIEMLMCPICYYGSAHEHDIDLDQFVIMFGALFSEGLSRPRDGVRRIIRLLERTYKERGGQLETAAGVQRIIVESGRAIGVRLESGRELRADTIISTAGLVETGRLASGQLQGLDESSETGRLGALSFVEAIAVLDQPVRNVGIEPAIIFFSTTPEFAYRRPDTLADPTSGVICMPENYRYEPGDADPGPDPMVRVTAQASYPLWRRVVPDPARYWKDADYIAAKQQVLPPLLDNAASVIGVDFRPHVTFTDLFTPLTVARYTFHPTGAIYGTPDKQRDGRTRWASNLFIAGTDQGFLGITGALLSGITVANLHVLKAEA
ncbi:MAG: phytoene desaturase family protein [Planctomycetota bacterium]